MLWILYRFLPLDCNYPILQLTSIFIFFLYLIKLCSFHQNILICLSIIYLYSNRKCIQITPKEHRIQFIIKYGISNIITILIKTGISHPKWKYSAFPVIFKLYCKFNLHIFRMSGGIPNQYSNCHNIPTNCQFIY